jgi:AcrR family transcriptional regulator
MKHDDARGRIVQFAASHIAQHGLEGAKIRDIAHDAEVSTALIHYHFATKTALLDATLAYAWDRAEALRIKSEIAGRSTSAAQRLADLIAISLPSRPERREGWLLWMELWLQAARDSGNRQIMDKLYDRISADFTALIKEGIALGEFTCADVEDTVSMIIALIDGYGIQAMMHPTAAAARKAKSFVDAAVAPLLGISGLPFRGAGGRRAGHS